MSFIKITSDKHPVICERYEQGESPSSIAADFDVRSQAIIEIVQKNGKRLRTFKEACQLRDAKRHIFSPAQEVGVVENYLANMSITDIAENLEVSQPTISRILRRHDILIRPKQRIHSLDETAFDDAENKPEAAYWCGIMMADGCISDYKGYINSLALALSGDDGQHVCQFRDFLKSTHAICVYDNSSPNSKKVSMLSIRSAAIVQSLARYGIGPRKSLTAEVKHLENNKWFWCGAVCGDGWIVGPLAEKYRYPVIGLCGSPRMMQQFLEYVRTITDTTASVNQFGKICRVSINGRHAVRLAEVLFGESPFALSRKLAIANLVVSLYRDKVWQWRGR